jgi:hypothetical protein
VSGIVGFGHQMSDLVNYKKSSAVIDSDTRLFAAFLVNVGFALYFLTPQMAHADNSESYQAFFRGVIASITIILLHAVLIRETAWMRLMAVLLMILPILGVLGAVLHLLVLAKG